MQQDNNIFDPEKITLIDFKTIKGQVNTPEIFDISKVIGHQLDNALQLSFNLDKKLAKADFSVSISTDSKGQNETEATGVFHLIFTYLIENLAALAIPDETKRLSLNLGLANALSSVTYSTSRGILLTKLQGTALQNFILPIINANKLLNNKKD